MCLRQIQDVDVVADAGAVGGVVVSAENLGALAALNAVQHHRNQIHDGVVSQVRPPGTRNVEVAQADPLQIPGALAVSHQPFADQLRLAVGVDGVTGHILGDHRQLGSSVHCGRGREDHLVDSGVLHCEENVGHTADVLLVVPGGAFDGLADLLACGEVNDRRHVFVHHEGRQRGAGFVQRHVKLHELGVADARCLATRQVVDDNDAIPALTQETDNMRADVAGAATNENAHGSRIRRAAPSGLPAQSLCSPRSACLTDALGEGRTLRTGHVAQVLLERTHLRA